MDFHQSGKQSYMCRIKSLLLLAITLNLLIAACNPATAVPATPPFGPVDLPAELQASPPPETHEALPPSATPTPMPELAMFWNPPGSEPGLARDVAAQLSPLISEAGMLWEERVTLSASDLADNVRLVVAIDPAPELVQYIQAAPSTQFLAIGVPGLSGAPNLTMIGTEGLRTDQQGFVAGVIAAMITPDWRVGTIGVSSSPASKGNINGFVNGGIYYCGLCRQVYPPFVDNQGKQIKYPLSVELPAGAQVDQWINAAADLIERGVTTVYLPPDAPLEKLSDYLGEKGVWILSGASISGPLPDHWVGIIHFDPLQEIEEVLSFILDGQGGKSFQIPLRIVQANPERFSPARQNLVENIMEDVSGGFIDTGVDLITGEKTY